MRLHYLLARAKQKLRACSKHSSFSQRERGKERKRDGGRERKKEREREEERERGRERDRVRKKERERGRGRERERAREILNMVAFFLFLKGMMGALAPFSYLVFKVY